ncbi:hypothetical protein FRC00_004865, partial [Tulasnella sp. 408]
MEEAIKRHDEEEEEEDHAVFQIPLRNLRDQQHTVHIEMDSRFTSTPASYQPTILLRLTPQYGQILHRRDLR